MDRVNYEDEGAQEDRYGPRGGRQEIKTQAFSLNRGYEADMQGYEACSAVS